MNTKLLVCDLDNTLYDWVGYFVTSFYSMVDKVIELIKCEREQLLDDFRVVHRKHHDSEHPFSVLETRTVRDHFSGCSTEEIANKLDPALHAFNISRKKSLRVYPGVHDVLEELRQDGIELVAHTESNFFAAVDRLGRLELDAYFNRIYCRTRTRSDHPMPEAARQWIDRYPIEKYVELSGDKRKPNAKVLCHICDGEDVRVNEAAYVGDSMARDIVMAKEAGVHAILAEYGAHHSEDEYSRLVRVTHWTEEDISRERELKEMSKNIVPDAILKNSFSEIVDALGLSK